MVMKIISKSKNIIGGDVSAALNKVVDDANKALSETHGIITRMDCDVSVGPAGASVSLNIVVNGEEPLYKEIIGINEKGITRENSIERVNNKLNKILSDKRGEIVDFFVKTIVSPLPGRVYTTIVVAVNGKRSVIVHTADARRQRLKVILDMLDNNPSAINIASVAKVFGVSRTIIYRDLHALGFSRNSDKKL